MKILCLDGNLSKILYSSSDSLSVLAYFLIDDIGGRSIDPLFEWLKNNEYEFVVLNYSFIKKNSPKVSIYCFYDGYEQEDNLHRDKFEIDIQDLIKIAKQWQELYSKYCYIKIIEENGAISLYGSCER